MKVDCYSAVSTGFPQILWILLFTLKPIPDALNSLRKRYTISHRDCVSILKAKASTTLISAGNRLVVQHILKHLLKQTKTVRLAD